ncbi:hypothetical protein SAMN04488044_1932 [Cognatishimia maritima]|uniref:DUF1989 domain-containing protein n=2 Tax=Cognatishimia maritima TaxID=870908 RepID=A0A1M5QAQ6_9RHOB|nr:hypothetical protein SAMN04488044_1932 [Cognatishimia maritima]
MLSPNISQNETPEQRYYRLKAEGSEGKSTFPELQKVERLKPLPEIPEANYLFQDQVPSRGYWSGHLRRGDGLRLVADKATGIATNFWNQNDRSERFNPGDTIKVQWTSDITVGRALLSDMGRAMASITTDTFGKSDCLAGASSPDRDTPEEWADSQSHFRRACLKNGLDKRDVGPVINFFSPVSVDKDGRIFWNAPSKQGPFTLDLRAEMDLFVVLTNCPHPLSPDQEAGGLTVTHFAPAACSETDLTRTGTPEAIRAFENTDALFGQRKRKS